MTSAGVTTRNDQPDTIGVMRTATLSGVSPIAWAFVVVGVFLRLEMFLRNRSLFVDEAALALNLRDRSWAELFAALDYAQTAPIGFLLVQKAVITAAGSGEYALRLIPLLAGVAALPVFLHLARRLLPRHLVASAVALMAFSTYHVFWSTDAKHYSLDVLLSISLVLLAMSWVQDRSWTNAIRLAAVGAAAPFFSYAAVIVMTAMAPLLVVRVLRDRSAVGAAPTRQLGAICVGWLIGVPSLVHALTATTPETGSYLAAFWHEGFLPFPVSASAIAMWYTGFMRFMHDPVGMHSVRLAWLFAAFVCAGTAWLVMKTRSSWWIVLAPVVGVLAYSMAGLYPIGARTTYTGRVVLFMVPFAYLLATAGAAWIRHKPLAAIVTVLLILPAALTAGRPHTRGEARDALAYAADQAKNSDVVYLSYALRHAYLYYQPEINGRLYWGVCAQSDRGAYIDDLEQLRGTPRLWVVQAYDLYREAALIREYMRLNAVQLDSVVQPLAEARLYSFPNGRSVPLPAQYLQPVAVPGRDTDCDGIFRPARTPS